MNLMVRVNLFEKMHLRTPGLMKKKFYIYCTKERYNFLLVGIW